MKRILKITGRIAGLVLVLLLMVAAYGEVRWDRTYEAPYPDLHASTDAAVIEQGRYLVFGPAHCGACHAPPEAIEAVGRGAEVPLSGGYSWKLPVGTIYAPNITPDPETGIGRYTDPELARLLRHAVRPDGRVAVPFMEFQNLADSDIVAILSYLRSQPAVRNEVSNIEPNLLGRTVIATLVRPRGPEGTPPAVAPASEPTLARGEYLVNSVANCAGCPSPRSLIDGSYTGPRLSGGSPMADENSPVAFVPPNLTPDPETGHIYGWTTEQFIARFRAGPIRQGSHMPWGCSRRCRTPT